MNKRLNKHKKGQKLLLYNKIMLDLILNRCKNNKINNNKLV